MRESPHTKLPDGPGYVCPQELRLWIQQPQQQQQQLATALEASTHQQQGTNSCSDGAVLNPAAHAVDTEAAEPKPKRQKRGMPRLLAHHGPRVFHWGTCILFDVDGVFVSEDDR